MNRTARVLEAPNSKAALLAMPTQATQGCGKFNVYIGIADEFSNKTYTKKWAAGEIARKPRKIDVKCKNCGRRVKFQWERGDNRGRPRPVTVYPRPDHMPRHALVKEMQARNAGFEDGVIPDTHLLNTEFTSVESSATENENEKWMREQQEKWRNEE